MYRDAPLFKALTGRRYDPDRNPWDPPLRPYFPAPRPPRQVNTKGRPTLDGAMRPLVWGHGRPHHPVATPQRRAKRSHF